MEIFKRLNLLHLVIVIYILLIVNSQFEIPIEKPIGRAQQDSFRMTLASSYGQW
jgi:hypothetical protein